MMQERLFHGGQQVGTGGFFDSIVKVVTAPVHAVTSVVEKIPVIGHVAAIVDEAATAPLNIATRIASGERLDHVALDTLKDQLKIAKDAAPYAATVVSLVPGIGSGAAAAIGAGAALAEGKSIDEAAKAAIRNAIPGGAVAQAAFDTAMKAAAGERLDKAVLDSARNLVPEGAARAAFDVGVAVATGQKIQNAIAKGLSDLTPAQVQAVLDQGQKALANTPGLSDALKSVPEGVASEGFKIAAGLLSQAGVSEKSISTVRNRLPSDMVSGFDTALKSQESHFAWLKNVTAAPATPQPPAKPASNTPTLKALPLKPKYGPYPHGMHR